MGAAGDMLCAALLELLPEAGRGAFIERVNALGIPGVRVSLESAVKCGICGSRLRVTVHGADEEELAQEHHGAHGHDHNHEHNHEHGHEHGGGHRHASLEDIYAIIGALDIPEEARSRAKAVYAAIAGAEGRVHGREAGEVHFHEVGALDAVADVVTACLLLHELAPGRVVCSPLRTGYGTVKCAHGILPVPAPATALLLEGVPAFAGDIAGEMTTPTGAALVKAFADGFGTMPPMSIERVGYGMGSRDFPAANCVRAMLGEALEGASPEHDVSELFCTIDDATAEDLGYAQEALLAAGALDVFTVPVGMKKGRPGTLLCCLCEYARREEFAKLMLLHTPTIGVRCYAPERYKLSRRVEEAETPFGKLRVKRSAGYGIEKSKPEYEDIARFARESGRTLADIRRELAGYID